jgi:hypothetical protein
MFREIKPPGANMSAETRHFLLTQEGFVREFTGEQAALIAAGANRLPEFADLRMRYLQVTFDPEADTEIRVQTAGASIRFDAEGRLSEAVPPDDSESINRFEHDTCVQWALREVAVLKTTIH